MLDDAGTEMDEELLELFLADSFEVLAQLKSFLGHFNGPSGNEYFERFGQQIDRIMGAAYTLSLKEIGDLSKLGKELGYKASQVPDLPKLLVIQSLLSQLLTDLEKLLKGLKKRERVRLDTVAPLLQKMTLASERLGDLRTSVKV